LFTGVPPGKSNSRLVMVSLVLPGSSGSCPVAIV
jgi:hypothetical protein